VISQSVTGTTTCGTVVNLVVSSGQPTVPNVVGETQAAAIAAITAVVNISYGSSTTECNDTVAAGNVISQSVTGAVNCGTVVNLVVSSGQPSVPNVVGSTQAAAIAAITAVANISYGSSTTECSNTVAAGNVISQSVTGTTTCGTAVNLVVSSGPCLQTISGYVVEIDGNTPVKDVLMSAGDTNTLTDANGHYEFSVSYGWSGVITPEKEGYVFEPNSSTYTNITQNYADVNYTATLKTFKISGYVLDSGNFTPISNTSVSAENGGGPWTSKYGGGSAMTDSTGYYEVFVDYNWSGKVTPAKYAYAFEPNGRSYENVNVDYTTGQDYAGTLLTFKITGYIMNKCSIPIKDVLVSADNGGGQAMTDANGLYEVWVSYAWSGTVTPEKLHYTFNPVGLSYSGVLVDQAGQNYTADNIYDLDCDGYIDIGDVGVMADSWLITGSPTPIPGDFNADGTVDFLDFAIFGNVWGD
ncbi:MAG: PASTA domain-containing protein, partial [Sedimentisphaerales bacterium]